MDQEKNREKQKRFKWVETEVILMNERFKKEFPNEDDLYPLLEGIITFDWFCDWN